MGFIIFIIGLVMGSFYNVLIYRIPRKEDFVKGRSHCTSCGKALSWYELIPVISYILQGGKCRGCKEKISPEYPLVELLTGIMFYTFYTMVGAGAELFFMCSFGSVLLVSAFVDRKHYIIPNKMIIAGLISGAGLAAALLLEADMVILSPSFKSLIFGGLLGFLGLLFIYILGLVIFRQEAFGMGDVKLGAVIGLHLGLLGTGAALYLGFMIGGLMSIVLLLSRRKKKNQAIPFGPFLAAGAVFAMLYGKEIVEYFAG